MNPSAAKAILIAGDLRHGSKAVPFQDNLRLSRYHIPDGFGGKSLVAAGLMLRGDQDEAPGSRFRPGGRTEGAQDADNGDVGGEDAEAHGCEDCKEDSERHEDRDHDREILLYASLG